MRRAVFFVPDEDVFVQERIRLSQATQPGSWEHLQATLFEWISQYSRGDDPQELRIGFFERVIPALQHFHAASHAEVKALDIVENYQTALALLSNAILWDAGESTIAVIRAVFQADGKDALIDRLCKPFVPQLEVTPTLLHPIPYRDLLQALDETQPLQQRNAILRYLRRYYEGIRSVSWYDTHLQQDGGFFGYWAFELAAAVKLFGCDDRPFADNMFYPRDLVHERMYRTWLHTGYGDSQRNAVAKLQKAWQKEADAQLGKIESELEKAQNSIRSFIEEALKFSQSDSSAKSSSKNFQRSVESLKFLSELSGLDTKELDQNPEMAKSLIVGMLQSMSATARKASQGNTEDFEGLKHVLGEATAKLTEAEGVDLQALEDAMPPELRQRLADLNQGDGKVAYEAKMNNFSKAVDQLMEDEKVEGEELVMALEKLAIEYGFAQPETSIQEKVKGKLDQKWNDLRKDKQMIDFTFEDLFQGKKPEQE